MKAIILTLLAASFFTQAQAGEYSKRQAVANDKYARAIEKNWEAGFIRNNQQLLAVAAAYRARNISCGDEEGINYHFCSSGICVNYTANHWRKLGATHPIIMPMHSCEARVGSFGCKFYNAPRGGVAINCLDNAGNERTLPTLRFPFEVYQ